MTEDRSKGEDRGSGQTAVANDREGTAEDLSAKVSGYADTLRDQAESGKDRAASGLEKAATEMRGRLDDGGVQAQVGTRLADGMESTAGYLRDHEAAEIWSDLESFVKEHPVQAAVTAAVAGFLVARLVR